MFINYKSIFSERYFKYINSSLRSHLSLLYLYRYRYRYMLFAENKLVKSVKLLPLNIKSIIPIQKYSHVIEA